MAWHGEVGHGSAWQAWQGEARFGTARQARHGKAGQVRTVPKAGKAGEEPHEGKHMSPTPRKYQKTAALRVRMSEQEMAALKRLAREKGCSLSWFVRQILRQQLAAK